MFLFVLGITSNVIEYPLKDAAKKSRCHCIGTAGVIIFWGVWVYVCPYVYVYMYICSLKTKGILNDVYVCTYIYMYTYIDVYI